MAQKRRLLLILLLHRVLNGQILLKPVSKVRFTTQTMAASTFLLSITTNLLTMGFFLLQELLEILTIMLEQKPLVDSTTQSRSIRSGGNLCRESFALARTSCVAFVFYTLRDMASFPLVKDSQIWVLAFPCEVILRFEQSGVRAIVVQCAHR